jgi:hypothetical protein
MKPTPIFYFEDEPKFASPESRAAIANRLRSYRCRENGNAARYTIKRISTGFYTVRLKTSGSPTACIITR